MIFLTFLQSFSLCICNHYGICTRCLYCLQPPISYTGRVYSQDTGESRNTSHYIRSRNFILTTMTWTYRNVLQICSSRTVSDSILFTREFEKKMRRGRHSWKPEERGGCLVSYFHEILNKCLQPLCSPHVLCLCHFFYFFSESFKELMFALELGD